MCSLSTIVRNSAFFLAAGSYYERIESDKCLVYDNYTWHEYDLSEMITEPDDTLRFKLNLDKCTGAGGEATGVSRLMNYLYARYGCPAVCLCPPKLGIRPYPLYSSLVRVILRQMIRIEIVRTMEERLYQRYRGFPSPEELSRADPAELRRILSLSRTRATALVEVARLFFEGLLSEGSPPSEVRVLLQRVKGVGEWTIVLGLIGAGYWGTISEKYYKRDCWIDACGLVPASMVKQPARVYLWAVSIFLRDTLSGRREIGIFCPALREGWLKCEGRSSSSTG